jgi:hypothetical protein
MFKAAGDKFHMILSRDNPEYFNLPRIVAYRRFFQRGMEVSTHFLNRNNIKLYKGHICEESKHGS